MAMETEKITINVNSEAMRAIRHKAKEAGVETSALIQRTIHELALSTGKLEAATAEHLKAQFDIIDQFVGLAKDLFSEGLFDEHFVLTVFRHAMALPDLRRQYELAVGGDAFAVKLEGKTPLNMYLGWYIKNAVGAEPKLGAERQPLRAQVRGEPIQSYTLLQHSAR